MYYTTTMQFIRCLKVIKVSTKHCANFTTEAKTAFRNSINSGRRIQHIVYFYLHGKNSWQEINQKINIPRINKDFKDVEDFLNSNPSVNNLDSHILKILPSYIASMKIRRTSKKTAEVCDILCSEIFDLYFSKQEEKSSLEFIHGWLNYYHPNFNQVQGLMCFGKLLQCRCREVLSCQEDEIENISQKLVHLTFLAGIGKKHFETHEILNQIATFCDSNVGHTYKALNPLDLAVMCESLFKGGIRIESEESLSSISSTLCHYLEDAIIADFPKTFNTFITISLLKILRQVNYIDSRLLRLLGELVLNPLCEEDMNNIRFSINIISAFSGPGRKLRHPVPDSSCDMSMEKILNRMEGLVVSILQKEKISVSRREKAIVGEDAEEESTLVMKSRLKDISRWLWTVAALGYQMRGPWEIYLKYLSHKFDAGQFKKNPADAVDALLALAIMNQYPDAIVLKIFSSADFRSAVKVNCSNRHKGRLGLFLTSLRIERSSQWRQLSPKDERQWFEAVRTSFTITEESAAWSSVHRSVKLLQVPGIKRDFRPHTQLLNLCMDALNKIFANNECSESSPENIGNFPNDITSVGDDSVDSLEGMGKVGVLQQRDHKKTRVLIGYAVPYLFIPGIKIIFSDSKREVYIEILDDIGLSSSYHEFKMRLMKKTHCNLIRVSRKEIENLDIETATAFLKPKLVDYMKYL